MPRKTVFMTKKTIREIEELEDRLRLQRNRPASRYQSEVLREAVAEYYNRKTLRVEVVRMGRPRR